MLLRNWNWITGDLTAFFPPERPSRPRAVRAARPLAEIRDEEAAKRAIREAAKAKERADKAAAKQARREAREAERKARWDARPTKPLAERMDLQEVIARRKLGVPWTHLAKQYGACDKTLRQVCYRIAPELKA